MEDYLSHIERYWDAGFSVLPMWKSHTKKASVENFLNKEISKRGLTEDEKNIIRRSECGGMGVLLGMVNGVNIGAVDFDYIEETEEVKLWIDSIPPSPVRKKGKKGFTSFYRFSKDIPSTGWKDKTKGIGIDILAHGKYTILPPTLHVETKEPYFWLTKETLIDFDLKDLPLITMEHICRLANFFGVSSEEGEKMIGAGRNNTLTIIMWAKLHDSYYKTDAELAQEILEYDLIHHESPYFKDRSEPENRRCLGDEKKAALFFVQRARKQFIRKNGEPSVVMSDQIKIINDKKDTAHAEFKNTTGLINDIKEKIISISRSDQQELALGGAISICATLASNRFSVKGKPVSTHLYIMNVADSGIGKGAAFEVAKNILGADGLSKYNLLGLRNYSSIASFIEDLAHQRSRLDVIDEFGSVLRGISSKNEYKQEIELLMNELFTINGIFFNGHKTKTSGITGACISPAVSLLANIQPATLIESMNKSMLESGFMSRFLYFYANNSAKYLGNQFCGRLDLYDVCKKAFELFPFEAMSAIVEGDIETDLSKIEPKRVDLFLAKNAQNAILDIDKTDFEESCTREDQKEKIFTSRRTQIAERLMYIHAVTNGRREVFLSDLEWAIHIVDNCYKNSLSRLTEGASENNFDRDCSKALNIISKAEDKQLSVRDICRAMRRKKKDIIEIMEYLVAAQYVDKITVAKNRDFFKKL